MSNVLTLAQVQTLVTDWNAKKKAADTAALAEREARALLVGSVFPELVEGAGNKADIGHNMILQVTGTITRKVDMAMLEPLKTTIPAEIMDLVIRMKPEVSASNWKAQPLSVKKLFGDAITETPGTPQVKLVPKKKPEEG